MRDQIEKKNEERMGLGTEFRERRRARESVKKKTVEKEQEGR